MNLNCKLFRLKAFRKLIGISFVHIIKHELVKLLLLNEILRRWKANFEFYLMNKLLEKLCMNYF